jgi:hypothetical protein
MPAWASFSYAPSGEPASWANARGDQAVVPANAAEPRMSRQG